MWFTGDFTVVVFAFCALSLFSLAESSQNFLVTLPRQLQCCHPEKVLVSVFNLNSGSVSTRLQVEDVSGQIVTQTGQIQVREDNSPVAFILTLPCQYVPKPKDPDAQRYVNVRAIGNGAVSFNRITRVAVKASPSIVLVQTDKPVYVEYDEVHVRVAVLGCDFRPCCGGDKECVCDVNLDIRNPQNIIVDRILVKSCSSEGAIQRKDIKLGPSPVEGDWTIIAKRTCDGSVISETYFEVKNYVLPRFDVTIKPPKYVKLASPNIEVEVIAKYTYGKGVQGKLDIDLGICDESSVNATVFKREQFTLTATDKGTKPLRFPNGGYGEFPRGKQLCIFAEVTEKASGITFGKTDRSAVFTDNPVKLDCDLTPPFYRPNLPLKLQVRARYPNGETVADQEISATEPNGQIKRQTTGDDGVADIVVDVGNSNGDIQIKVDVEGQALGKVCVFREFCSPCGGHLTVRARRGGNIKVGRRADFEIIKANSDNRQLTITTVVIARGTIQSTQSLRTNAGPLTSFQVQITPQLANRFCILAYYMDSCNKLVSDVVCLKTEETCANEISLEPTTQILQPGMQGTLNVNVACRNSDIALLAVDKGLYILNSENRLSRDKMFAALDNCSQSCGYTVASPDGMFDVVGLAGMSDVSINPQCSCCTASCRSSCLNADDSCGSRRKKRKSEDVERMCTALKRLVSRYSGNAVEYCTKAYSKWVDNGDFNFNELLPGSTRNDQVAYKTEEIAHYLYHECCLKGFDLARSGAQGDNDLFQREDPNFVKKRTYFPHVWLQERVLTNGDLTTLRVDFTVPDSITEWSVYGLAQCCDLGFCVSKPVSINVFKDIFVECHLPFSLKRQEQVSVACTAYNYNQNPTAAWMKVVRPPETLCTTAGTGTETNWIKFSLKGFDTKTVLIPVIPLSVGTTQLTVQLRSELSADEIVQDIVVVPEGVTRELDSTVELDPLGVNMDGSKRCTLLPAPDLRLGQCFKSMLRNGNCNEPIGGEYTKEECCTQQISKFAMAFRAYGENCELCASRNETHYCNGFCRCGGNEYDKSQTNFFPVRVPEDHIGGSVTAWLGVSGRYFTVGENMEGQVDEISGVEGMLRIPGGCGEQSMLIFGPNCAIVTFLHATNPESTQRHLQLLQNGYNYQLRYRVASSGGFTVWQGTTPSTWLSSFVLRTMCCAREFVVVDNSVVSGLINFLGTRRQNEKFVEPQNVYHREMVGGVQESDVSMTAYTVMSLLACCRDDEKSTLRTIVCPAVRYMQIQVSAGLINRPYAQAIVYKALVKACICGCGVCNTTGICDHALINKLRKSLFDKAVVENDGSMHWEADTRMGKAYWYHRPSAISVEMTAYVLQACLCIADCQCARATAKWLNTARNSRGAFVSTQDTVVALTALAEFAAGCRVTVLHPPNLCVTVRLASDPLKTFKNFRITPKNADVMHRISVPVNELIRVDTCGSGLGRAMVHYEYNVPGNAIEQCAFDISVNATDMRMNIFEPQHGAGISYCVRYLGSGCTTMAVVEVELSTGYQPCDRLQDDRADWLCLSTIKRDRGEELGLSKYEISDKSVVFYFDKLCDTVDTCVIFKTYRKFEVVHSLPVSVRVFDYYEPDVQCTEFYTLGGGSPELGLICDDSNKEQPTCVCGAGRCPRVEKEIHKRLCNACIHHDYVYNVRINKETYENGWFKISVTVVDEIKPGIVKLKNGEQIYLWLPSICKIDIELKIGNCYHIQGRDGTKFVLDHNTLIEPCPTTTARDCKDDVKKKCVKKPCKRHNKNKVRRDCERKRQKKCSDQFDGCNRIAKFEEYVKKLRIGETCEEANLCSH